MNMVMSENLPTLPIIPIPDVYGASYGIVRSGKVARIFPSPMTVKIAEGRFPLLNEHLKRRKNDLELFAGLVADNESFRVPKITNWQDGDANSLAMLEVELAKEVEIGNVDIKNLLGSHFARITTEAKHMALIAYLDGIQIINTKGHILGDKNPNGIFIDTTDQSVRVWVVDPGLVALTGGDIESLGGSNAMEMCGKPDLGDLMLRFFTPESDRYLQLVPKKVSDAAHKVKDGTISSVSNLIEEVGSVGNSDLRVAEAYRRNIIDE